MIGSHARTAVRDTRFWQAYDRSRYAILFYALLLTMFVLPVTATIGLPPMVLKVLLGISLVAAVMPNSTRKSRYVLLTGILLIVIARTASEAGYLPMNPALLLVIVGLIGLGAAGAALRFSILAKRVDSETLYAALSTYLLAGVFFGQIYWSINALQPGSLVGPDPLTEESAIYYSFVTLATLGYGDFLPRSDIARGLAMFEVIGGQLFLAVMVARLIGSFTSKGQEA